VIANVIADARHLPIAASSVQCVVTSPPYFGLRDYGTAKWQGGADDCNHLQQYDLVKSTLRGGRLYPETEKMMHKDRHAFRDKCGKCGAIRTDQQIGLERTPEEYVAQIVAVFREVWRVLKSDGTVWLNLGDSYAGSGGDGGRTPRQARNHGSFSGTPPYFGLPRKNLLGIPWRVAFALQADGWYLRSDIIWAKPNPMPESVTDRPTRSHEYIFLLSKNPRYYYDAEAISEPAIYAGEVKPIGPKTLSRGQAAGRGIAPSGNGIADYYIKPERRNRRSVWTLSSECSSETHFAIFPQKLVEACILAGSAVGSLVLDPFSGSGTVGRVCARLQRSFIGCDINPDYSEIAERRQSNVQVEMIFAEVSNGFH
jgi:DNA modification methylase